MTVVGAGDANVFEPPPAVAALQSLSERWRQRATNVGMEPEAELFRGKGFLYNIRYNKLYHKLLYMYIYVCIISYVRHIISLAARSSSGTRSRPRRCWPPWA